MARLSIRGVRGRNRIRFFGEVRGRTLEHGRYVIGVRPVQMRRARWTGVEVGADGARAIGRAETAAAVARCRPAPAGDTTHLAGLTVGKRGDLGSPPPSGAPSPQPGLPPPVEQPERGGVLPSIGEVLEPLPDASAELPLAVGLGALALLALSGLGMIVFLVRFLRRGDEA